MSMLICGENRERLRVTGDIETSSVFTGRPTADTGSAIRTER